MQVDLPALGLDFAVPIFFFASTADQQTPIELAEQYYEQIWAPPKCRAAMDTHNDIILSKIRTMDAASRVPTVVERRICGSLRAPRRPTPMRTIARATPLSKFVYRRQVTGI